MIKTLKAKIAATILTTMAGGFIVGVANAYMDVDRLKGRVVQLEKEKDTIHNELKEINVKLDKVLWYLLEKGNANGGKVK